MRRRNPLKEARRLVLFSEPVMIGQETLRPLVDLAVAGQAADKALPTMAKRLHDMYGPALCVDERGIHVFRKCKVQHTWFDDATKLLDGKHT